MGKDSFFPDIVTNLPTADIPLEGLRAYLLQGENQQIIFMAFDNDVQVPEHLHEAQWGAVLDGEIHLTIDGKESRLGKGDTYFIPGGVRHSAIIKSGYKDLTLFDQENRYRLKSDCK